MKYTIEKLKEQKDAEFLFFWGHQPSKDGSIIKTCMSQWWPADFVQNKIVYKTAEHYMMAGKAELFGSPETFHKIIACASPKDVKALGRQIRNFDSKTWDNNKYDIVLKGNELKFSQNEELKQFLIGTGNKILVEASPVDAVWGIGMAEDDPQAKDPAAWRGENLLGFALMEVRDKLNKS